MLFGLGIFDEGIFHDTPRIIKTFGPQNETHNHCMIDFFFECIIQYFASEEGTNTNVHM